MYNFKEGHTIVLGLTQSGKTYAVKKILSKSTNGVLFFNTQQENLEGYINANKNTPFIQIAKLLRLHKKINYLPDTRLKIQFIEVDFLINMLFEHKLFSKSNPINIVIDEAHLFEGRALDNINRIATSGIRWGLNGIFISQRPANLSNTLMSQSSHMLIFKTNMEIQYFKNYSIPIEQILEEINKNGLYSFCEYDFLTITAYKKI
jgi:DNA helicase HerA-like ATPase